MFPDLTAHPDYLKGQSIAWCDQLAAKTGKYEYPWRSVCEGASAEELFADKLTVLLHGKVLDVGCGHGEYTNRWSGLADEVVGYDMTEGFIATANRNRLPNVRYVLGRTHDGLPFPDDDFDAAYTKKGPTSWYAEGNRIVRPGGTLLFLHPGDGNGNGGELGEYFPGLFVGPSSGTPIGDRIRERLETSGLTDIQWSDLTETVWIPTPGDILAMVCFGQSDRFRHDVEASCYAKIVKQFDKHAGEKGIRTTGRYYLIEAKASS